MYYSLNVLILCIHIPVYVILEGILWLEILPAFYRYHDKKHTFQKIIIF
jgi:hypothetical protein